MRDLGRCNGASTWSSARSAATRRNSSCGSSCEAFGSTKRRRRLTRRSTLDTRRLRMGREFGVATVGWGRGVLLVGMLVLVAVGCQRADPVKDLKDRVTKY